LFGRIKFYVKVSCFWISRCANWILKPNLLKSCRILDLNAVEDQHNT